jgi:hypothetical protein
LGACYLRVTVLVLVWSPATPAPKQAQMIFGAYVDQQAGASFETFNVLMRKRNLENAESAVSLLSLAAPLSSAI